MTAPSYHTGANWHIMLGAVGLVIATPVATWWLIGDLGNIQTDTGPDYLVRPIELDPVVQDVAGIGSVLTVTMTLLLLTWASLRRRIDLRWWAVALQILTAGYIVGTGWGAMTTGVIGANIGAGMTILLGAPAVVMLLMWAVFRSLDLLQSGSRKPMADDSWCSVSQAARTGDPPDLGQLRHPR